MSLNNFGVSGHGLPPIYYSTAQGRAMDATRAVAQGHPRAQELVKMARLDGEPLPGHESAFARPVKGCLTLRGGQVRFNDGLRAAAGISAPVQQAIANKNGVVRVTMTPIGDLTGTSVAPNTPIIVFGRMYYSVAIDP